MYIIYILIYRIFNIKLFAYNELDEIEIDVNSE